ncbi:hypothetical protein [Actinoplanes subglobosus]|uniref:Uncharacterized protein n=1 Tax=Actinoplanes subglobosus TaxID=1547892 RepID=A0ABV8J739_9ACTN
MRGSRPDPDLLQQWVCEEGVPPARVGARLGLSRAVGYAWLQRYAITAGGPRTTQNALVGRWSSGTPIEALAAELGLSPAAVDERLSAAVTRSRRYHPLGGPDDPLPPDLLRDLYVRRGLPVREIATRTGATDRQVRYRLSRYGIARPGRPDPCQDTVARARAAILRASATVARTRTILAATRATRSTRRSPSQGK